MWHRPWAQKLPSELYAANFTGHISRCIFAGALHICGYSNDLQGWQYSSLSRMCRVTAKRSFSLPTTCRVDNPVIRKAQSGSPRSYGLCCIMLVLLGILSEEDPYWLFPYGRSSYWGWPRFMPTIDVVFLGLSWTFLFSMWKLQMYDLFACKLTFCRLTVKRDSSWHLFTKESWSKGG